MLVGEDRHEAGQRRWIEIVEQTLGQAFDDQEIGLVERAGEATAGIGELPAVDVPPPLEDPQHAVELPSDRLAAALHP